MRGRQSVFDTWFTVFAPLPLPSFLPPPLSLAFNVRGLVTFVAATVVVVVVVVVVCLRVLSPLLLLMLRHFGC